MTHAPALNQYPDDDDDYIEFCVGAIEDRGSDWHVYTWGDTLFIIPKEDNPKPELYWNGRVYGARGINIGLIVAHRGIILDDRHGNFYPMVPYYVPPEKAGDTTSA